MAPVRPPDRRRLESRDLGVRSHDEHMGPLESGFVTGCAMDPWDGVRPRIGPDDPVWRSRRPGRPERHVVARDPGGTASRAARSDRDRRKRACRPRLARPTQRRPFADHRLFGLSRTERAGRHDPRPARRRPLVHRYGCVGRRPVLLSGLRHQRDGRRAAFRTGRRDPGWTTSRDDGDAVRNSRTGRLVHLGRRDGDPPSDGRPRRGRRHLGSDGWRIVADLHRKLLCHLGWHSLGRLLLPRRGRQYGADADGPRRDRYRAAILPSDSVRDRGRPILVPIGGERIVRNLRRDERGRFGPVPTGRGRLATLFHPILGRRRPSRPRVVRHGRRRSRGGRACGHLRRRHLGSFRGRQPVRRAGANGWYVGPVLVSIEASDGMTGATISYRLDGGDWIEYRGSFVVSGDGGHTVEYNAVDGVGNSFGGSASVSIDGTAPHSVLSADGLCGRHGWFVSEVGLTIDSVDAASGVAQIQGSIDGGAPIRYTSAISLGDGIHTIVYAATDAAGNLEPLQSAIVSVDSTAPRSTISLFGTAGDHGWYRSSVVASLRSEDATSGIASLGYRLDGGGWVSYDGAIAMTSGSHTIQFAASDVAGLTEPVQSVVFCVA